MMALQVRGSGGSDQVVWEEVPSLGHPNPGEVLVQVAATAVNRADLLQIMGRYPPPPGVTTIPGLEMAGTVVEVGRGVTGWKVGDRVCALLSGGGYAEEVLVDHRLLLGLPSGMTFEEGAALPEAFLTAFSNVIVDGRLRRGEAVLVHAGASGVGAAAIRLAVAVGAIPIATVGSALKERFCRELGAALVVNRHTASFEEQLRDEYPEGVHLVLDCVGASYLGPNLTVLRKGGRLLLVGLLGGARGEIDLSIVLRKGLTISGSTLRSRPIEEKVSLVRRFEREFWPLVLSGELRSPIDSVFPITEAARALAHVRSDGNLGKVVLRVRSEGLLHHSLVEN